MAGEGKRLQELHQKAVDANPEPTEESTASRKNGGKGAAEPEGETAADIAKDMGNADDAALMKRLRKAYTDADKALLGTVKGEIGKQVNAATAPLMDTIDGLEKRVETQEQQIETLATSVKQLSHLVKLLLEVAKG